MTPTRWVSSEGSSFRLTSLGLGRACSSTLAFADNRDLVPVSEEVVPVVGVVHHQTSLGVFLEVAQRRVFIPANCMTTPSQVFEVGEPVTVWVLRRFAEQEGLNP